MQDLTNWDWNVGKKQIADVSQWKDKFGYMEEPYISPDGEKVAAIVRNEDEEFTLCENGEAWESGFDKAWYLRYTPDNRLTALVSELGEWTIAIDGETWENKFEFVWNPKVSPDGQNITLAAKLDGEYMIVTNNTPWENTFSQLTNMAVSRDVLNAAIVVQSVPFPTADIFAFQKGCYSVAVNGEVWDKNFVNVWEPSFNRDGQHVAAQVRVNLYDYTIVVDGKPWNTIYPMIWQPQFSPEGIVTAPVKTPQGWTLASDGREVWDRKFVQLFHHQYAPKGGRIAAIVAPKFGIWTVAVDGKLWNPTFNELVTDLTFSADGSRIACITKTDGKWGLMVDGNDWVCKYDMVFQPVFSPDSRHAGAKVERNGRYTYLIDGKLMKETYKAMENPIFSPDGEKVLVRAIEGEGDQAVCIRQVVALNEILG